MAIRADRQQVSRRRDDVMTNLEVEPAVRLRAASIVFRALVNGMEPSVAKHGDLRRITWEEYLKGISLVRCLAPSAWITVVGCMTKTSSFRFR